VQVFAIIGVVFFGFLRTENISNGTSAFLPEVDDLELGIVPRLQGLSNSGYASTAASFLFAACTNLIRRRNPFSKTPQTAGGRLLV
jgi:hypothetical protein